MPRPRAHSKEIASGREMLQHVATWFCNALLYMHITTCSSVATRWKNALENPVQRILEEEIAQVAATVVAVAPWERVHRAFELGRILRHKVPGRAEVIVDDVKHLTTTCTLHQRIISTLKQHTSLPLVLSTTIGTLSTIISTLSTIISTLSAIISTVSAIISTLSTTIGAADTIISTYHSDVPAVRLVHKLPQLVRRAIAPRRRKERHAVVPATYNVLTDTTLVLTQH